MTTKHRVNANPKKAALELSRSDASLLREHVDADRQSLRPLLRPAQATGIEILASKLEEKLPVRQGYSVYPPGFGKTVFAVHVISALYDGKRMFIGVAPNDELLQKNLRELQKHAPHLYHEENNTKKVAVFSGVRKGVITKDTKIILSTPLLLAKLFSQDAIKVELDTVYLPDETHEMLTDLRTIPIEKLREVNALDFGLTATDILPSGKTVGDCLYEGREPHVRMPIRESVEEGYVCPFGFSIRDVEVELDSEKVMRDAKRDYPTSTPKQLKTIVNIEHAKSSMEARINLDARKWATEVNPYTGEELFDKPKFVYVQKHKLAVYSAEQYNNLYGAGTAAVYDSTMSAAERKEVWKDYEKGKIKVLISVRCLSRGIDHKPLANIAIIGNATSALLLIQEIGRSIRLDPTNPEKFAFVTQYVDTKRHPQTVLISEALGTFRPILRIGQEVHLQMQGEGESYIEVRNKESKYKYKTYVNSTDLGQVTKLAHLRRGSSTILLPKAPSSRGSLAQEFYSYEEILYLLQKTDNVTLNATLRKKIASSFSLLEKELRGSGKPIDSAYETISGVEVIFAGSELGNVLHVDLFAFLNSMKIDAQLAYLEYSPFNDLDFFDNMAIEDDLACFFADSAGTSIPKSLFKKLTIEDVLQLKADLADEYLAAMEKLPEEDRFTEVLETSYGIRAKLVGDSKEDIDDIYISKADWIEYCREKTGIKDLSQSRPAHEAALIDKPTLRRRDGSGKYINEDQAEQLIHNLASDLSLQFGDKQVAFLLQDLRNFFEATFVNRPNFSNLPYKTSYGVNVAQKIIRNKETHVVEEKQILICAGDLAAYCLNKVHDRTKKLVAEAEKSKPNKMLVEQDFQSIMVFIEIDEIEKYAKYLGHELDDNVMAVLKERLELIEKRVIEESKHSGVFNNVELEYAEGRLKDPSNDEEYLYDYDPANQCLIECFVVAKKIDGKTKVKFEIDTTLCNDYYSLPSPGIKTSKRARKKSMDTDSFGGFISLSQLMSKASEDGYEIPLDFIKKFRIGAEAEIKDRIAPHLNYYYKRPYIKTLQLNNGMHVLVDYFESEDESLVIEDARVLYDYKSAIQAFVDEIGSEISKTVKKTDNQYAYELATRTSGQHTALKGLDGDYERIVKTLALSGESKTNKAVRRHQSTRRQTLLFNAIESNDIDKIKEILDADPALLNEISREQKNLVNLSAGMTPLTYAVSTRKSSAFFEISNRLKPEDLNKYDGHGWTALHHAISSNAIDNTAANRGLEYVKTLTDKGADVNLPTKDGITPAEMCTKAQGKNGLQHYLILQQLVDLGASVEANQHNLTL